MDELNEIRGILERYLSPMIARSMLQRALRERSITPEQYKRSDAHKLGPLLERGVLLFVSEADRESALRALATLCEETRPTAAACRVELTTENDVSIVRNEARRIGEEVGADSYTVQKVTTMVSELARNIVMYAGSGTLEIIPINDHQRRLVIRASDKGPGIPNLQLVLSGRYRSKTGLGRGLLGTKRLADHFDVVSGPEGTRVVAEIRL
jgi:serine/threonine-protein kinase RsbT